MPAFGTAEEQYRLRLCIQSLAAGGGVLPVHHGRFGTALCRPDEDGDAARFEPLPHPAPCSRTDHGTGGGRGAGAAPRTAGGDKTVDESRDLAAKAAANCPAWTARAGGHAGFPTIAAAQAACRAAVPVVAVGQSTDP